MQATFDITGITIETPRLILRGFIQEDLDDFFEYASVEGVGERAGWPHHKDKEVTQGVLTRFIEGKKTFALVHKEENKVIGSLGIEFYKLEDKLSEFFSYKGRELGFVLAKPYWGQGLMKEAVAKVIDYLFNVLDYDFLLCSHYEENIASMKVQRRCGFIPYRKTTFETQWGEEKTGIMNLLLNPKKDIELVFSHPETLIYKR